VRPPRAQSQVGGGGRYDGLIEQLGGQPTPAIGWAIGSGADRARAGRARAAQRVDVFIVAHPDSRARALELATSLRRAGVSADLDLAERSQKGQMKQADRSGAGTTVILDGDSAELRDMKTGEQSRSRTTKSSRS
jgi:histidyl-tRNA synthetase